MINKNPIILSIETSGTVCGVNLQKGDSVLFEQNIDEPNLHDKMLASLVYEAIKEINLDYSLLDAIAVSAGPGSFTGLRIGAALAKGLVFDSDIKLIAVPTMDAIACQFDKNLNDGEEMIVLIPSHKNLFYFNRFDKNCNKKGEIMLMKREEIEKLKNNNLVFAGPGADFFPEVKKIPNSTKLFAGIIANYAYMLYFENEFVQANEFIPFYVQEFIPKTKEL